MGGDMPKPPRHKIFYPNFILPNSASLKQLHSEKPLKILFISSWYPNEAQPTLGNFVQKHAQAAALYNNIAVISVVSSTKKSAILLEKQTVRGVNELIAYFPKNKGILSKLVNYFRHKKAFLAAFQAYRSEHGLPDLVHVHVSFPLGIWAMRIKKKYGIPYLVTEHASGFHLETDHAYPRQIVVLCKKILSGAKMILPVSENLKRSLQQLVPSQHFEVVSNVVDEHIFTIQKNDIHEHTRFIHISTGVDKIKNLSGIIRAVDQLSQKRQDFTLDIVSDGDVDYAKVQASKMQHSALVRFHATKTTEEIAGMLGQSDSLVLSSHYENFPCVIAEAFMCGIPVISTNVNGIPEHVHPDLGILLEKGNEKQLTDAMETIIDGQLDTLSEKLRSYALIHFSYAVIGERLNELYRRIVC